MYVVYLYYCELQGARTDTGGTVSMKGMKDDDLSISLFFPVFFFLKKKKVEKDETIELLSKRKDHRQLSISFFLFFALAMTVYMYVHTSVQYNIYTSPLW